MSQGKGLTANAARVSALMEAIELHCAESLAPAGQGRATIDEATFWARIPKAFEQEAMFDPLGARGWCAAVDLLSGAAMRVPHGLVSMDCTVQRPADLWPNTNGLAAGNDAVEAQVSALCEAVERDAQARWMAARPRARRATAIDPATIGDRAGRWLLARVARAGLRCALWDMSAAHGIATIGCAIVDPAPAATLALPPAFGAGCHPRAPIALARAITEAAQTRSALIAGARDDLSPADYADPGGQRAALTFAMHDFGGGPMRAFADVPDCRLTLPAARERLLAICEAAGAGRVPCVDLSPAGANIAVVRVVVPGFGDHDRPSALPAFAA